MIRRFFKPPWIPHALVAPFAMRIEVDEGAFRASPQLALPHVDALVPLTTAGKFIYSTPKEHKKSIKRGICQNSCQLAKAVDLPIIPLQYPPRSRMPICHTR